jgi:hypothetical protein
MEPVRLLCGTFNLGNAKPEDDLSPWIPKFGGDYDIIVIASQECTYSEKSKKGDDDDEDETPIALEATHSSRSFLAGARATAAEGLSSGGLLGAISSTASFISGQAAVAASCDFFAIVQRHLGLDFTLLQSVLMWQTGILVFIRRSFLPLVTCVESGAEATGLLGVAPNKARES